MYIWPVIQLQPRKILEIVTTKHDLFMNKTKIVLADKNSYLGAHELSMIWSWFERSAASLAVSVCRKGHCGASVQSAQKLYTSQVKQPIAV